MNLIVTLLVVGIMIASLVWYRQRRQRIQRLAGPHSTALKILETRYECGEIDQEEYRQKRADILANHVAADDA